MLPFGSPSQPVLAIGLDAFDCLELERRLARGDLPNLARVAEMSTFSRLAPDTPGFGGMTWPGFINALPVAEHGWYFSKFWSPDTGRIEKTNADFQRVRPFWQSLQDEGLRIGLVDVPKAPRPIGHFDGVFINGWQTHDPDHLHVQPVSLLGDIEERFGVPILQLEQYGNQRVADLLDLHENVLMAIEQITAITEWLLRRDCFDFFMVVLGASHRAGHYLWDLSQIDQSELSRDSRRCLDDAMDDVYDACDDAVGRIIAAAPHAVPTIFAVHGMRANPGWNEVFPEMLKGLAGEKADQSQSSGLRHYLHEFRRTPLAMKAQRQLPEWAKRAIGRAWSLRMHDWSSTNFFSLPSEVASLVRFNVNGREPEGIVDPAGYPEFCDRLAAELLALRDLETEEVLVEDVHITDRAISPHAPYRDYLPDLLVEWGDRRLVDSIGVRLPNGRDLRWPRGRRSSSGRSGNHRRFGWMMGDAQLNTWPPTEPTTVDLACSLRRHFDHDPHIERVAANPRDVMAVDDFGR
ncbi:MAG: alkaline phosphatase family protein [Pseudomonadota bacterium]